MDQWEDSLENPAKIIRGLAYFPKAGCPTYVMVSTQPVTLHGHLGIDTLSPPCLPSLDYDGAQQYLPHCPVAIPCQITHVRFARQFEIIIFMGAYRI